MEQLAKQDAYKSVKFLNVAVEELPEIAQQHEIEAVPTVSHYYAYKPYSYLIYLMSLSGHLLPKSKGYSQNRRNRHRRPNKCMQDIGWSYEYRRD